MAARHDLEAVGAARRGYKVARLYRKRAGRGRSKYKVKPARYAGEGEFHERLREAGLSIDAFEQLSGVTRMSIFRWYGHPMLRWPVALLEQFIRAENMAAFLKAKGWDPEQFRAKGLPPAPQGHYPRNAAQADAVRAAILPAMVECPVHGPQKALGGECPKC